MSTIERIPSAASAPALRLGIGCASLGSRIAPHAGLAALAAAYDAGVRWCDVAPAYGLGQAESLLGDFLAGRRDRVVVTTKVGIAPPKRIGLMKGIYAIGRPALSVTSGLRGAFRKVKATRNIHVPLESSLIETSIVRSLERLRTDRVDIYALHDPRPEDVLRDDVLSALQRVARRGQAVRIAVAGSAEACRAALAAPEVYSVLQMSVASFESDRKTFLASTNTIVLHSIFGVAGALDAARASITASGGDPASAADVLLARALTTNPNGPVLASMFSRDHLAANIRVAHAHPFGSSLSFKEQIQA